MSTNRRFKILSGTSMSSPMSQFWELGNLTGVDPTIPNMALEGGAQTPTQFGWQASFESKWKPYSIGSRSDSTVGPLDQVSVIIPRPEFGWYMAFDQPRRKPFIPQADQFSFVAPIISRPFDWYGQFDQPAKKKIARSDEAPAFVAVPAQQVPFGWYTPFENKPIRKALAPTTEQSTFVGAPVKSPSFGWYAQFAEGRKQKPRIFEQEIVTPIVPARPLNFGWYMAFVGQAARRNNTVESWAFVPRIPEVVTFNNLNLNATDPQDTGTITITNIPWGGGGLYPWEGLGGEFGKNRPKRPVESEIVTDPPLDGIGRAKKAKPFVPVIAAPQAPLLYPENTNMLLKQSDDQIIIDLLL